MNGLKRDARGVDLERWGVRLNVGSELKGRKVKQGGGVELKGRMDGRRGGVKIFSQCLQLNKHLTKNYHRWIHN